MGCSITWCYKWVAGVFSPYLFNTVDGRNPANQLRLVVNPIISKVHTFPGGFLAGFLVAINVKGGK